MSNNFAIITHIKIKGAEAHNGVLAEADRSISGNNVDKSRTHKNITIIENPYENYDDFVQVKQAEIAEANMLDIIWNKQNQNDQKKSRRFPRKTTNKKTKNIEESALSQQIVFTHSPGIMSEDDSIKYLKLADKFIRNWFQDNEVISSVIHLDETTPHLHVDIAYFDKNDKRFNQKILFESGKTDFDAIRDAFQKEVADRFGMIAQDGSVVDKGKHEQRADLNRAADKEALKNANYEISKAKNETFLTTREKELEIKRLQAEADQSSKLINEKDAQITSHTTLITEKDEKIVDLENKELETVEVEVVKIVRDTSDIVKIKELENRIKQLKKENEELVKLPSMNDWEKRDTEIEELRNEKEKLSLEVKNLPTIEEYKRLQHRNIAIEAEKGALKVEIELLPTHDELEKEEKLNEAFREENIKLKNKNRELEKQSKMEKLQIKELEGKLKASVLKLAEASKPKAIEKPKTTISPVLKEASEIDLGTTQERGIK